MHTTDKKVTNAVDWKAVSFPDLKSYDTQMARRGGRGGIGGWEDSRYSVTHTLPRNSLRKF